MKTFLVQALLCSSFAICSHQELLSAQSDAVDSSSACSTLPSLDAVTIQIIGDTCREFIDSKANQDRSIGAIELALIDNDFDMLIKQIDQNLRISPLDLIAKTLKTFAKSQQTPEYKIETFNQIEKIINNNKSSIEKEKHCKKNEIIQQIIRSNLSHKQQEKLILNLENAKKQPKKHKKSPKKVKKISIINQQ